jgi:hypothetical protein
LEVSHAHILAAGTTHQIVEPESDSFGGAASEFGKAFSANSWNEGEFVEGGEVLGLGAVG